MMRRGTDNLPRRPNVSHVAAMIHGMTLTSNPAATALRRDDLAAYMDEHVLGPAGFCCRTGLECRTSVESRKAPADFAYGQLPHLGMFYDLKEESIPLRILVIAMEIGRTDTEITLAMRRLQVLGSADLAPRSRNPHMVGVTHALRTLHGREIGDDSAGEMLDLGSENPVHLFDAYAMTNVRLCTSVRQGTTESYPTAVMTKNCIRHLRESITILEPTVCVVQGAGIPKYLAPLVSRRTQITDSLADVTICGVNTLMAEFSHPTAHGGHNWGRWTNMPYLQNTVIPTLRQARLTLGLSANRDAQSSPTPSA